MKMIMSSDLKSRYTTMLNGLVDKCSYLDPRFCSTYLLNKDEVIFEIKQEAVSVAEKDVPSPSSEMIDEGNNEEPPKRN